MSTSTTARATTVKWKLDRKFLFLVKLKKIVFYKTCCIFVDSLSSFFVFDKKDSFFRHKLVRLFILIYVTWKWEMYKPKEMWSYIHWYMLDFIYKLINHILVGGWLPFEWWWYSQAKLPYSLEGKEWSVLCWTIKERFLWICRGCKKYSKWREIHHAKSMKFRNSSEMIMMIHPHIIVIVD